MLAAESAWRVLISEHAQMRGLLADIARSIEEPDWFRSPTLDRVRKLVRALQRFDQEFHRPKGTALSAALRQRGPSMERLLDELESEGDECTELLAGATALLADLNHSDASAAQACAAALRAHAALMLKHLEREDTELRTRALQALGPDEWSRIVSSISATIRRQSM